MRTSLLLGAWRSIGKFELMALAFKFAWAVRVSLPDAHFDAVGRPFHNLSVLPVEVWAALTFVNLIVHLAGVVFSRAGLRQLCLTFDIGWWLFLTTQEFQHAPSQTGGGMIAVITVIALAALFEVAGGER